MNKKSYELWSSDLKFSVFPRYYLLLLSCDENVEIPFGRILHHTFQYFRLIQHLSLCTIQPFSGKLYTLIWSPNVTLSPSP
jgi:hypothetical protein